MGWTEIVRMSLILYVVIRIYVCPWKLGVGIFAAFSLLAGKARVL